ncbi:YhdP family protein [Methyloradius palustris]|nr:YhdP family protein [Methyloradius palustris]
MVKKSLLWVYRAALVTLWLIIIVLATSVLSLRYIVLPHIDTYKDKIVAEVSAAVGHPITIGDLKASWDGLNPHFSMLDVQLYDAENRPALSLSHIEATLSWLSIPLFEPRLSSLAVYKPELTVRREADGTLYVAGIAMGGPARPELANWILRQDQIDVSDATILWQDDLRKAPPLTLNNLRLAIVSPAWKGILGQHRFALRATPSAGSSSPIDIRGNIYGKDVSELNDWRGTIYGKLEGTDIAAWRHWVDYPFDLREGFGAAQFWLDFSKGAPQKITTDVIFTQVKTRLSKNSAEATLNNLSGRLSWIKYDDGQEVKAERIKALTSDGLNMQNGNLALRERSADGKEWTEGSIQLDEVELATLNTFVAYLPLPAATLKQIADIAPEGKLEKLDASWKGSVNQTNEYSIRSKFTDLGMKPYENFPGFSNLSGSIDADETDGSLSINSQKAELNLEKVMRWPIPADKLTGEVKWNIQKNQTQISVNNLAIVNEHLAGTINGSYLLNHLRGGYLNLTAKLGHGNAAYAHYYYPKTIGEHTLHWLDTSILGGKLEDINVTIKGNLADFPFPNNKDGLFRVTAKLDDGLLEYGSSWPKIDGIKLDMLFEGVRMELNATAGNILGNKIIKAKVAIPQLHTEAPILTVVADGAGPVSEGIKFINNSPVHRVTDGFTDTLRTSGNGNLHLELMVPLKDEDATKVKGTYTITNGSMADQEIPELSKINGKLEFTESGLHAQNVNTWIYGGPAQFNLATSKDHSVKINARGRLTDSGLKQTFGAGIADGLSGSADWAADIGVVQKQLELVVSSSLVGMASTLPPPLNKAAGDVMYLKVEKKQTSATQDLITASLGTNIAAKIQRADQNGVMKIDRGEIGLNVAPALPTQQGLNIRGTLDNLDADEWRSIFSKTSAPNNTNTSNANTDFSIAKVDLVINTLDIFDKRINGLKLIAKPIADGWSANVQSQEVTGDVQWHKPGNGKIVAKLKNLISPATTPGTAILKTQGDFKQQSEQYPALDITADNFEIGKKKLGKLELLASEQNDDWSIEKLRMVTPESTINAEGEWHNWKRSPNTRINITWDITDLGKTLERFGYPNTIKGGDATLTGQLKWPGSPHEFDTLGLSGNLQLDADHGQILKIQPGVGRLFSVLSLQNLPRRLTFDFRDVFSSGFTFDKITSSVKINNGVMRSDDFKMEGPTARVEIKGETDIQKETQHLYVKVTPYVSDSLSLAALAGGPAVGGAVWLAQKLLKDPINKFAADEYEIVGTWDNPQELKSPELKSDEKIPAIRPLNK